MDSWRHQIPLLGGILLFLAMLPALGSPALALVGSGLLVATVAAGCGLIDHLAPVHPPEQA